MLDDVQCTGSENKLLACSSAPVLRVSSNCDHTLDAGVRCEGIPHSLLIFCVLFILCKTLLDTVG